MAALSACSWLLPGEWREELSGAAPPATDVVADWIAFANAQTDQFGKANERTRAVIDIVERCEESDRAVRSARPKALRVF